VSQCPQASNSFYLLKSDHKDPYETEQIIVYQVQTNNNNVSVSQTAASAVNIIESILTFK